MRAGAFFVWACWFGGARGSSALPRLTATAGITQERRQVPSDAADRRDHAFCARLVGWRISALWHVLARRSGQPVGHGACDGRPVPTHGAAAPDKKRAGRAGPRNWGLFREKVIECAGS
jgi:hypothetical protein